MTGQSPSRQEQVSGGAPRRQRLTPERRRVLLLDAAATVFARHGFNGARMEDVAREAGVAKGLLYRHFASKEELFGALMVERGADFTSRLQAAWEVVATSGAADQTALVDAGLEVWLEEAASDNTMLNWVEPAQWGLVSGFRDQTLAAVAAQLSAADASLDADRAEIIAAAFQGALESAVLHWRRARAVPLSELHRIVAAFGSGGLDAARQLETRPAGAE